MVGARSAVFAPTPHLGLIVLDEEHDASFKQDNGPALPCPRRGVVAGPGREHAAGARLGHAVAGKLAAGADRASTGWWSCPRRVLDRPLPDVGTIDLRVEFQRAASRGAVSRQLHLAIAEALRDGGQVILLLNRRGYSTSIQCPACGHVVRCPDCDIALTHHREANKAVCHYCDYTIAPAGQLPGMRVRRASATPAWARSGWSRRSAAGFRDVACLRMDSDSMQRPGSHEQALARFRSGEVKILLGTQMIAKGLDFPNVTLVGVINADTALHFPDFRAAERTFQLVTQVAGRTGRGDKGGRVLVQTFSPDHPAIQAAVRHDYRRLRPAELPIRREFGYPPFAAMIRLVVRGPRGAAGRAVRRSAGRAAAGGHRAPPPPPSK